MFTRHDQKAKFNLRVRNVQSYVSHSAHILYLSVERKVPQIRMVEPQTPLYSVWVNQRNVAAKSRTSSAQTYIFKKLVRNFFNRPSYKHMCKCLVYVCFVDRFGRKKHLNYSPPTIKKKRQAEGTRGVIYNSNTMYLMRM